MPDPTEVRLRYIAYVSFRQNELTSYRDFMLENPSLARSLKGNDAVCFISQTREQLIFVYGFREWEDAAETQRVALVSQRVRLTGGGSWNPMMLANYAASVGLKLVGAKKFEELYEEERAKRTE